MAEAELMSIKRQLAKVVDGANVTDEKRADDLLQELGTFTMTESLLLKTGLGRLVGGLRKASSASLANRAKTLIAKWKDQCNVSPSSSSSSASLARTSSTGTPTAQSSSQGDVPPSPSPIQRTQSNIDADIDSTVKLVGSLGDVRDKNIRFLAKALFTEYTGEPPVDRIAAIVKSIEAAALALSSGDVKGEPYRAKVRQLVFNLGDRANSKLRGRVLSGGISADELCRLSARELANDEVKREMAVLEKEILHDAVTAQPSGQETDQFKCGKCGQRRTRYTQAQTRSADEPMTTFVSCVVCGNRWKFC